MENEANKYLEAFSEYTEQFKSENLFEFKCTKCQKHLGYGLKEQNIKNGDLCLTCGLEKLKDDPMANKV